MTTAQKIKDIEDEMARTQKNKATEYHLGQLKAKLAKLRRDLITPAGGGGGGPGIGFDVARSGQASIGLVGFPSVGKSTLMSGLTGQHSEAASYEFTTLTTVPGEMVYNGAKLQILDLPGIIQGAKDGKGRGKQVIAVARTCNLIWIVLDVLKPLDDLRVLVSELEGFGIRLNRKPPNISIKKRETGGVQITNTVPLTKVDQGEIRAVLQEYRMTSCQVMIHEPDCTIEDFIDVVEGNRMYVPCLFVLNKIDAISIEELDLLYKIPNSVPISSKVSTTYPNSADKPPGVDEHRRADGDDVGQAGPRPRLHQAQGQAARLHPARRPAPRPVHCRELLRRHPQGDQAEFQVRHGVRHISQALARPKGRHRPCPRGPGCHYAVQEVDACIICL